MEFKEILSRFVGTACVGCGGRKTARTAFCGTCYISLPFELRRRLWRRIGDGFEEAYAEAVPLLPPLHVLPALPAPRSAGGAR